MAFLLAAAVFCLATAGGTPSPPANVYAWNLPKGFPEPWVPPDNPMTAEKVELGRHLFYDRRMSSNGKSACATCHRQGLAFTDGRAVSAGTTGEPHPRNAMSLVNIAYSGVLTWSDPGMTRLEDQALVPMFGTHPVELGLRQGDGFISILREDRVYRRLFAAAFPRERAPFTIDGVVKAIACFERSIISARSPYDRYHYDRDDDAVSDSVRRGEVLFFSQRCACFHCHGGFYFSDAAMTKQSVGRSVEFHNNGLYNLAGPFSYPASNLGIYEHTKRMDDVGKFKAPTLRNIAVTGPYMHDGSIPTLEGVIDHYAAGGRAIHAGPYAGDGSKNPNKDPRVGGFPMSNQDRANLVAFLDSLTDREVLRDPRFADPWPPSAENSFPAKSGNDQLGRQMGVGDRGESRGRARD